MSEEPSWRVVVEMRRERRKINFESFVEDGIAAKATGLVENERERR